MSIPMDLAPRRGPNEPLDLTAVMVFTVSAFGLGGFSVFSLLSLLAR